MLEPNYGDGAPEGWGILFEEGFLLHRLLLALLFVSFFHGMAVLVWRVCTLGTGAIDWTDICLAVGSCIWFFSLLFTA
jgi:hypothetical protein